MKAIEIRNKYLDFFKRHGHAVIPSAPLIPENDPSVLFTTAGMQPLVPYLLGEKHPEGTRLTDFQKCLRTNDIDEVGDNRHLTYFEMLGNWSLGDYFKEESIAMSFEFLTKELGIPVEKLSVTCFAGDKDCQRDEVTASCWKKAEFQKIESIILEKMITGGLPEKKDLVDQIQKCFMIQESQNAQKIVTHLVDVVNMLKFGITYLWNSSRQKMENTQN